MPRIRSYPQTSASYRKRYTKRGLVRHVVTIRHAGLGKSRDITDASMDTAYSKANDQLAQWDQQWRRQMSYRDKQTKREEDVKRFEKQSQEAILQTEQAELMLEGASTLLSRGIPRGCKLTPRSKRYQFSDKEPAEPKKKSLRQVPERPTLQELPAEPQPDLRHRPSEGDWKYRVEKGFLAWLTGGSRSKREMNAKTLLEDDLSAWEEKQQTARSRWEDQCNEIVKQNEVLTSEWEAEVAAVEEENARRIFTYETRMADWKARQVRWGEKKAAHETALQEFFERYRAGDADAVATYLSGVMHDSPYPDWVPNERDVAYIPETKVALVDQRLPLPDDLPGVKEVTYVRMRDKFNAKEISRKERDELYDSVIYQIALRTLHEGFKSTGIKLVESVVFNGYVKTTDASTGKRIQPCILSVQTTRSEFSEIDLSLVDPKECVRKLRGIGSSKLHALAPVAPILTLDRADSRFVASRDVVGSINQGTNLAAMPWDDFEHLIRGLFEKMFADRGAEVRVTQASRDRGVDAVVFDPDPITGGKIIIQAKRYTNPVQASDVRELYGVVQHEGAKLGILVTTTDYGPDAIQWAADKPIRLLTGGNLLHELQKQGHQAYIDVKEAKEILKEQEADGRGSR